MKESEILKNLSMERHLHDHLITLLATFEQSGQYFLVFPWADGDLDRYWTKINPAPSTDDASLAMWVIDQCQGIAEGLSKVHRYNTKSNTTMLDQSQGRQTSARDTDDAPRALSLIGRHGDIKPENILWFPDREAKGSHGILKITDFGIARFTPENRAAKREGGFVPNSLTYRSPECDLPGEEISAQCDVWALGCVYLVFLTWFFGGGSAVKTFGIRRTASDNGWHGMDTDNFFITTTDNAGVRRAKVKEAVIKVSNLNFESR